MNAIQYPFRGTPSPETVLLCASFDCNGSSAPASVKGDATGVTRDGTGTYTVTFKGGAQPQLIGAIAFLEGDFTAGDYVKVSATDNSAGTVEITTADGGGATDIPSGDAARVVVLAWVRNTSAVL